MNILVGFDNILSTLCCKRKRDTWFREHYLHGGPVTKCHVYYQDGMSAVAARNTTNLKRVRIRELRSEINRRLPHSSPVLQLDTSVVKKVYVQHNKGNLKQNVYIISMNTKVKFICGRTY